MSPNATWQQIVASSLDWDQAHTKLDDALKGSRLAIAAGARKDLRMAWIATLPKITVAATPCTPAMPCMTASIALNSAIDSSNGRPMRASVTPRNRKRTIPYATRADP